MAAGPYGSAAFILSVAGHIFRKTAARRCATERLVGRVERGAKGYFGGSGTCEDGTPPLQVVVRHIPENGPCRCLAEIRIIGMRDPPCPTSTRGYNG